MISSDATTPPIHPIISSFTKEKSPHNILRISPAHSILDDPKEVAEPLESQTVSSDISPHSPLSSTTRIQPQPGNSSESIKLQLPMASSSVFSVAAESVSILSSGKAAASTSTGISASSMLASAPDMADASSLGEDKPDRVQISDTITAQNVAVKAGSPAAVAPPLTLVSAPRPPPGIPRRMILELKRVLEKSTEERQRFLEKELKFTRRIMDELMTVTGKKERKQVTDLWQQKIRWASSVSPDSLDFVWWLNFLAVSLDAWRL